MLFSFIKERKLIKGGKAPSFGKQDSVLVTSMKFGVKLQFESQLACYKLWDNLKCISVAPVVPLPLAVVVLNENTWDVTSTVPGTQQT